MIPLNSLTALLCIITPDQLPPYAEVPCPLSSLSQVAISLELLEYYERKNYFTQRSCVEHDLQEVQNRYEKLHDAPFLIDAERLPPFSVCREANKLTYHYIEWLQEQQYLFPTQRGWYDEAIMESRELHLAWDCAEDAVNTKFSIYSRRMALKNLRNTIGPYYYYSGCLPPPVPLWRFRIID